ncbi:class I SAM-dependent methyltransferase [Plantactinospora sp. S1510]|uniref:Class I SAM-dependent methyltransferase n=1 Tax=Plantactinospora alkalitolerans TaxID=2789879 RepID=A0ABS0GPB3_9ACTN|nr:class I SAM-dependent methyltransferase [Plantactinospora alkalitolerans]MBF9128028.1 class I SAM-dependent methyltransferase [Plantactinospora alkalitolerans]
MAVVSLFEAVAGSYDESCRRLVPCFDDFYGTAVEVAAPPLRRALASGRIPSVLDLGAGTGLLSILLGAAVPGIRPTLLDGAPAMLAVAGGQLGRLGVPHETLVADLTAPLPAGPYDAVVSALAIHHLDDAGKRDLYRRIRQVLVPGGVFVNAEQVAGATPDLDHRYDEVWLAQVTALGATEAEIAGARERMRHGRPVPVPDQRRWLVEAGFVGVDCFYKSWRFAVFGGRRELE